MNDFDYLFILMALLDGVTEVEDKLQLLVAVENHASDKQLVKAVHEARYVTNNPTPELTFHGIPCTIDPDFENKWGTQVGAVLISWPEELKDFI